MGRDDRLRAFARQLRQQRDQPQARGEGQRRLRLVEEVQASIDDSRLQHLDESLAWLLSCRSSPPNRSIHLPDLWTSVKSSCIFSARRKKPPLPPRRVPSSRRARFSSESSCDGCALAFSETLWRSARTCLAQAAAIASTSVDLPLPFSPIRIVNPGAGSKPFSTRSRTAGIVYGHWSARTLPLSTSIRRSGAPFRTVTAGTHTR